MQSRLNRPEEEPPGRREVVLQRVGGFSTVTTLPALCRDAAELIIGLLHLTVTAPVGAQGCMLQGRLPELVLQRKRGVVEPEREKSLSVGGHFGRGELPGLLHPMRQNDVLPESSHAHTGVTKH